MYVFEASSIMGLLHKITLSIFQLLFVFVFQASGSGIRQSDPHPNGGFKVYVSVVVIFKYSLVPELSTAAKERFLKGAFTG